MEGKDNDFSSVCMEVIRVLERFNLFGSIIFLFNDVWEQVYLQSMWFAILDDLDLVGLLVPCFTFSMRRIFLQHQISFLHFFVQFGGYTWIKKS